MVEKKSKDDAAFKVEIDSAEPESEGTEEPKKVSDPGDKTETKDVKPPRTVLQFLKAEKEILTTVAFFIGGAIWLYAAFATKQYVGSIKCLLGATIERIDNEAQAKQLLLEIVDLSVQLKRLDTAGLPAADLIVQSETLKQKIEGSKNRQKLAEEIVKKASQRVQNGECGE